MENKQGKRMRSLGRIPESMKKLAREQQSIEQIRKEQRVNAISAERIQKMSRIALSECYFNKHKEAVVNNWALDNARRKEEFLYKCDLKNSSPIALKSKNYKQAYYCAKVREKYEKYKELIRPNFSNFVDEKERTESPKKYDFGYVEKIKLSLAKRKVYISAKTIEPELFIPNYLLNLFPSGGEMLQKF